MLRVFLSTFWSEDLELFPEKASGDQDRAPDEGVKV